MRSTTAPLGWCLTGHHPQCPGKIDSLSHRLVCSCSCHDAGTQAGA